jgi:hypothetical protein
MLGPYLNRVGLAGRQLLLQLGDVKFSIGIDKVLRYRYFSIAADLLDGDRLLVEVHVGRVKGDVAARADALHADDDLESIL